MAMAKYRKLFAGNSSISLSITDNSLMNALNYCYFFFYRLSAIFGASYCLKMWVDAIIVANNSVRSIYVDNQRVNCKYLICGSNFAPREFTTGLRTVRISRAIFLAAGTIFEGGSKNHYLLRIPGPVPVNVIQTCNVSYTAPKDLYIVYAWCESLCGNAKQDLLPIAKKLFDFSPRGMDSGDTGVSDTSDNQQPQSKPRLVWCKFFSQNFYDAYSGNGNCGYDNLKIVSPPSSELDFDFAIQEAVKIFGMMFPGEEFLPRAPDYEDLVMDDNPQLEAAEDHQQPIH